MSYSSIRQDYCGARERIVRRGGNISEREFKASFPAGIDLLNRPNANPITIHHGRKSSGNPWVMLMPVNSEGINPDTVSSKYVSMTELLYGMESVATMLDHGGCDSVPVRKIFSNGEPGPVVAYAARPMALGLGQAA